MQMIILIHPFPAIYVGSGSGVGSLSRDSCQYDMVETSYLGAILDRCPKHLSWLFIVWRSSSMNDQAPPHVSKDEPITGI